MPNDRPTRTAIAEALLHRIPLMARISVAEDRQFRERFNIVLDATISLNGGSVSFGRRALFEAIRRLTLGAEGEVKVISTEGMLWRICHGAQWGYVAKHQTTELPLPDFGCLSPDPKRRVDWLDQRIREFRLDAENLGKWRDILVSRELEDEEADQLLSEFRTAPLYVERAVANHLRGDSLEISSLVPADVRYYENLIGKMDQSLSLSEYAGVASAFLGKIDREAPFESLKHALLFSAHSTLIKPLDLTVVDRESLVQFYHRLSKHGDRFSQVGTIECGIRYLGQIPQLAAALEAMIRTLLSDDSKNAEGRMALLSALITLVEAELSRTGILRQRPPFWRRLASIAHASVLEREILSAGIPASLFVGWSKQGASQFFYLQCLLDLRREPRWLPEFASPEQLQMEFFGRIAFVATENFGAVESAGLTTLLLKEDGDGLRSRVRIPFALLPGPLEGDTDPGRDLPEELAAQIRSSLERQDVRAESFFSLVNLALIFRIGPAFVELAIQAIRRAKHQVRELGSNEETLSLVAGLAMVAAVARNQELSEEVRTVARAMRRRRGVDVRPGNEVRLALIAAAAHPEKDKWVQSVGDWFVELAFEDTTPEVSEQLRARIRLLCQLEPQLWESCARAEAACAAHSLLRAAS